MRRTDHVLMVGEGALQFARMHGFTEENLLTEKARKAWVAWRERLSDKDDWVDPEENGEFGKDFVRTTGTIHVGCVDANGDVGGCTTTSGLAFKIPGRVGDSPLIGCGNYVDNEVGVAGSTGRGEAVIVTNGGHRVVGYMADGKSPTDACLAALRDVVRFTKVKRLLRADGRPDFQVKFYAINKAGEIGSAALYPTRYARATEAGAELADAAALCEGGRRRKGSASARLEFDPAGLCLVDPAHASDPLLELRGRDRSRSEREASIDADALAVQRRERQAVVDHRVDLASRGGHLDPAVSGAWIDGQ